MIKFTELELRSLTMKGIHNLVNFSSHHNQIASNIYKIINLTLLCLTLPGIELVRYTFVGCAASADGFGGFGGQEKSWGRRWEAVASGGGKTSIEKR